MSKRLKSLISVCAWLIVLIWLSRFLSAVIIAEDSFFCGSGSEADPFHIYSSSDIQKLSELSEQENSFYMESNFVVMNDLNLSGISDWSPIGTPENPFSGTFDGQGSSIRNFHLIESNSAAATHGLFGVSLGTISNLTIADVSIRIHHDVDSPLQLAKDSSLSVAALVASNRGTVENIQVSGFIEVDLQLPRSEVSYIGAVAARNEGSIEGVHNSAGLRFETMDGGDDATPVANIGGISGINDLGGEITLSTNKGRVEHIEAYSYIASAGGIAGRNSGRITFSANTAAISSIGAGGSAGGIAGCVEFGQVENSYNHGRIEAAFSGGLIGSGLDAHISRSYNIGVVEGTRGGGSIAGSAYYMPIRIDKTYAKNDGTDAVGTVLFPGRAEVDVSYLSADAFKVADSFPKLDMRWDWMIPPYGLNRSTPAFRAIVSGAFLNAPDQIVYEYGEALNLSGSVLHYSVGHLESLTREISIDMLHGNELEEDFQTGSYDPYLLGEQIIHFSDEILSGSFTVTVVRNEPISTPTPTAQEPTPAPSVSEPTQSIPESTLTESAFEPPSKPEPSTVIGTPTASSETTKTAATDETSRTDSEYASTESEVQLTTTDAERIDPPVTGDFIPRSLKIVLIIVGVLSLSVLTGILLDFFKKR